MSRVYRYSLFIVAVGSLLFGCASSAVDPRTTIEAPNEEYRGRLAQAVNGSKLWKAYLEFRDPGGAMGKPLIAVRLNMERHVTRRSTGGDYDPGEVRIRFSVSETRSRAVLYQEDKRKRLDDVIFGLFDENATREEIQRVAFEEAEGDVFPYLDRWLNVAALRAIAQTGRAGDSFVPILEAQADDPWAEDLSTEAKHALRAIRGGN
jgi:hypothetical protein